MLWFKDSYLFCKMVVNSEKSCSLSSRQTAGKADVANEVWRQPAGEHFLDQWMSAFCSNQAFNLLGETQPHDRG